MAKSNKVGKMQQDQSNGSSNILLSIVANNKHMFPPYAASEYSRS